MSAKMNFLGRLWLYLLSKTSEVKYLDYKDMLAALLITKINANKVSERKMFIPIERLQYLHKIDRKNALDKVNDRKKIIREHEKQLRKSKKISQEWLVKYFPSITHFKAVSYKDGYVVYEGNGRLMAIKNVINSGVEIEVDVIEIKGSVERMIGKVRQVNGLE